MQYICTVSDISFLFMVLPSDFQATRSISVSGNVTGSVVQTGDSNIGAINYQRATLPQPETVDISSEVAALRELLTQLESADKRKIENALADAEEELQKPEPDKDEVGQALDRALNYAEKANGFADAVNKLRPRVEKAVGWLGDNWYKLLAIVGLTV